MAMYADILAELPHARSARFMHRGTYDIKSPNKIRTFFGYYLHETRIADGKKHKH